MHLRIMAAFLMTSLTLAACDDAETKRQSQRAEQTVRSQAELANASKAAEERLLSTARNITPAAKLRGVAVHRQALGGYAVCGQVNFTGAAEDPYLPFVSIVSPDAGRIEQFVAVGSAEATRTYVETNTRCFDRGGPRRRRVDDTKLARPSQLAGSMARCSNVREIIRDGGFVRLGT